MAMASGSDTVWSNTFSPVPPLSLSPPHAAYEPWQMSMLRSFAYSLAPHHVPEPTPSLNANPRLNGKIGGAHVLCECWTGAHRSALKCAVDPPQRASRYDCRTCAVEAALDTRPPPSPPPSGKLEGKPRGKAKRESQEGKPRGKTKRESQEGKPRGNVKREREGKSKRPEQQPKGGDDNVRQNQGGKIEQKRATCPYTDHCSGSHCPGPSAQRIPYLRDQFRRRGAPEPAIMQDIDTLPECDA
jgi:hypothetical protein